MFGACAVFLKVNSAGAFEAEDWMGMTETGGVTFVAIARVAAEGVTAFRAYEDRVLCLSA